MLPDVQSDIQCQQPGQQIEYGLNTISHGFIAAGKNVDGHGRDLSQEHRRHISQEQAEQNDRGYTVSSAQPPILEQNDQTQQQRGIDLAKQPVEQHA